MSRLQPHHTIIRDAREPYSTNEPVPSPTELKTWTRVPNWILRKAHLSHTAEVVYTRLLSYAHKDPYSFPSQNTLMRDAGVSRATLHRALDELVDRHLIRVSVRFNPKHPSKGNTYYLMCWIPSKADEEEETDF